MSLNINYLAPVQQAVSTTPLTVLGASSWTGADPNLAVDRLYSLTNSGSADLYVQFNSVGTPSSTSFCRRIPAGGNETIFVKANDYIKAVAASGSLNITVVGETK